MYIYISYVYTICIVTSYLVNSCKFMICSQRSKYIQVAIQAFRRKVRMFHVRINQLMTATKIGSNRIQKPKGDLSTKSPWNRRKSWGTARSQLAKARLKLLHA